MFGLNAVDQYEHKQNDNVVNPIIPLGKTPRFPATVWVIHQVFWVLFPFKIHMHHLACYSVVFLHCQHHQKADK